MLLSYGIGKILLNILAALTGSPPTINVNEIECMS